MANHDYLLTSKINNGTYGDIYSTNNPDIVCKVSEHSSNLGLDEAFLREISSLKVLANHPYVVKITNFDCTTVRSEIYMKYYPVDLSDIINNKQEKLDPDEIKHIMYEILSTVKYAHEKNIINGDIKPANILMDENGHIAVCDWGLSLYMTDYDHLKETHVMQTITYRAPEVLCRQCPYSSKVDVWSIGIIFCELIRRRCLFKTEAVMKDKGKIEDPLLQLQHTFSVFGYPSMELWDAIYKKKKIDYNNENIRTGTYQIRNIVNTDDYNCLHLIDLLTQYDPEKRISCAEALQHPYFTSGCILAPILISRPLIIRPIINPLKNGHSNKDRVNALNESYNLLHDHNVPMFAYFMGCIYFDTYLSRAEVDKDHFLVVCHCCMWLACKVLDYNKLKFIEIFENLRIFLPSHLWRLLTIDSFRELELRIVHCLDFSMYRPNLFHAIRTQIVKSKVSSHKVKYIVNTCYRMTHHPDIYMYSYDHIAQILVAICKNLDTSSFEPKEVNFVQSVLLP